MTKLSLYVALLLLVGCASTHDMSNGGPSALGGGYLEEKVFDGVYRLEVKLDRLPWSSQSSANEKWHKRAVQLCEDKGYRELNARGRSEHQLSYGYSLPIGGGVFMSGSSAIYGKRGYVVCSYVDKEDDDIMDEIWDSMSAAK